MRKDGINRMVYSIKSDRILIYRMVQCMYAGDVFNSAYILILRQNTIDYNRIFTLIFFVYSI